MLPPPLFPTRLSMLRLEMLVLLVTPTPPAFGLRPRPKGQGQCVAMTPRSTVRGQSKFKPFTHRTH